MLTFPAPGGQFLRECHRRHQRHRPAAPMALVDAAAAISDSRVLRHAIDHSNGARRRTARSVEPLREPAGAASGLLPRRGAADQGRSAGESESARASAGGARFCAHRLHGRPRARRSESLPPSAHRRSSPRRSCSPRSTSSAVTSCSAPDCAGKTRAGATLIRGPIAAPAVPTDGQRCWLPYAIGDRNANPNATFAALPDPTEPSAFPSGCTL